jgi:hypothetical protein
MRFNRPPRFLLQFVIPIVCAIVSQGGHLYAQGPTNVSVTPSTGTGMSQTFTAVYSDAGGYPQMQVAMILIQPPSFTSYGFYDCFAYYNKWSNGLYLLADAGGPWLGPITAGASGTLSNSQCTLDGAGSSVNGSANTLTVGYSITFNGMGTWTVGTS